jgi:hypothetical protein
MFMPVLGGLVLDSQPWVKILWLQFFFAYLSFLKQNDNTPLNQVTTNSYHITHSLSFTAILDFGATESVKFRKHFLWQLTK